VPRSPLTLGLTDADWEPIEDILQSRLVPPILRAELRGKLAGRYDGLLLYGSWARGDADCESDLDTLLLNFRGMQPDRAGRVSVAKYNDVELANVSETLFGYHLVRDGVILFDRVEQLSRILESIRPPVPRAVTARIRSLSPVLDVSSDDRSKYMEGLTQVARYLLRSALYAEALGQGEPCFSVREIAERKQDPSLAIVLSSHAAVRPAAGSAVLTDLQVRLNTVIGPLLDARPLVVLVLASLDLVELSLNGHANTPQHGAV
jgi:predicted nucleotidyltransferase